MSESQNKETTRMSQQNFYEAYGGSAPENYERYFVPVIGAPLATDLIDIAALRPGERVLDVASGQPSASAGAHLGKGQVEIVSWGFSDGLGDLSCCSDPRNSGRTARVGRHRPGAARQHNQRQVCDFFHRRGWSFLLGWSWYGPDT
jgi:hypothetical protein